MSAEALIDVARRLNLRIAAAESCTGGMVSAALTDIPGSSAVVGTRILCLVMGRLIPTMSAS